MSPAPVAAPAPTAAPKPPAAPAAAAPAAPAAPASAAAPGSAPAGAAAAPSGPAAAGAAALPKEVVGLAETTKALDAAWVNSAQQAKAAVAALGKDAQLPDDLKAPVSRLEFIGLVLQPDVPKDLPQVTLAKDADPAKTIKQAEADFVHSIASVAQQAEGVLKGLPQDAPKEAVAVVSAANERIMDAMYAVKFSMRVAPPPAPKDAPAGGTTPQPKDGQAAPAPGGATPAPAPAPAPTGTPAPAPAPWPPAQPGK